MRLDSFLARARVVFLVLPLFAIGSALHAGCTGTTSSGYYDPYDPYGPYGPYGYAPYDR
ncbi:MAG: hypothetical protein KF819_40400 [Labilithrix sp.]|nr:hypothetical protein [Labilithrix sp.]